MLARERRCSSGCRPGTSSRWPTPTSPSVGWSSTTPQKRRSGANARSNWRAARRHRGGGLCPQQHGCGEFRANPDEGRLKLERSAGAGAAPRPRGTRRAELQSADHVPGATPTVRMRRLISPTGLEYCTEVEARHVADICSVCRARLELELGRWDEAAGLGRSRPTRTRVAHARPHVGALDARASARTARRSRRPRRRSKRRARRLASRPSSGSIARRRPRAPRQPGWTGDGRDRRGDRACATTWPDRLGWADVRETRWRAGARGPGSRIEPPDGVPEPSGSSSPASRAWPPNSSEPKAQSTTPPSPPSQLHVARRYELSRSAPRARRKARRRDRRPAAARARRACGPTGPPSEHRPRTPPG